MTEKIHKSEYPEKGELVVCTVSNVVDFGTFVELEEYGNKEGLIHISELASGWIKHVRDHVQEGQKVVCKVLEVDPTKGQVNLSLKDVNEHQKREKIQEWKNEQKADRWIEFVQDRSGKSEQDIKNLIDTLTREYDGLLYPAFEDIVLNGKDALIKLDIEEDLVDSFYDVAIENVEIPYVEVTGYLSLKSPHSDGVKRINEALKKAEEIKENNVDINVSYVGAPYYRIKVKAPDYKSAENALSDASERVIASMEELDGEGHFQREIDEDE